MRQVNLLWQRKWGRHGLVPLLFYTIATVVLTYPVIAYLETRAAGLHFSDAFESVRLIWWSKEALLQGMHPAYQPLLVYPEGFFDPTFWAAPLAHLSGVPFALLFSPLAAYNLTFLTANILTGWAAYALTWELTRHDGAALLGGLVFLAFPTRMGHVVGAHLGLFVNYWWLLYLWSLVRIWRGAGWRTGALGGVFLALTAGTHTTNIAFQLLPMTALWGGLMAWRCRRSWRDWLRPMAALAGVGLVGLAFFYTPMLLSYLNGELRFLTDSGAAVFSTDLAAFITPSPFNPVAASLNLVPAWGYDVLHDNIIEGPAYLGIVAVILAGTALWKRRCLAKPWLVTMLFAMVISLGPLLKVADELVHLSVDGGNYASYVALPYLAYQQIPGLGLIRTPGRMNYVTAVALAVLAAYGWAVISERVRCLRASVWQSGAVIVLAAVMIVEYQLYAPFPMIEVSQPAYYTQLAADAARGEVRPVLNLPAENFFTKLWLLYDQTLHHQPVIAGHVIRTSPANPAMIQLVNEAARPQPEGGFFPPLTPEQQASIIRAAGAEVVVVHRYFDASMADHLVGVLGSPVYSDDRVTVFEVPPGPAPEAVSYAVFGGWSAGDPAGRWLEDELTLSYYLPEAAGGYWEFGAQAWLYDRWLSLDLLPEQPERYRIITGAGEAGPRYRSSWYPLPQGFQQVRFWVPFDVRQGCTVLPDETLCRSALIETPRLVLADDPAVDVNFDGKMRLVDDSMTRLAAGHYELDFYWQALGAEREDYTMFVHLLAEDGARITQWDRPIGGIQMGTSTWPENGLGYEQALLTFEEGELAAGTYQVFVGLYTYPDIVRLPVTADGPRADEMLLYLDDIVVPAPDDR